MGKKDYTLNPYNAEPRIKLIDLDDNLIRMVTQIEAFRLLRHGFCELQMVMPPTIQFQLPRKEWHEKYAHSKHPKWLRNRTKYLEARKSILYGNYHIQAPDGHEMFHCNAQKALWYLNRDLADIVSDTPPTLRLTFTPGGPGHIGDPYYLTEKENRCVVCGAVQDLNRHHVMPRIFRRYLDEEIKDHNYHDILLLCLPCHIKYEEEAGKFKQQICNEMGIEINDGGGQIYLPEIGNAVKAARALLHFGHMIPEPRKEFLRGHVRTYLNKEEITDEDIKEVAGHFAWKVADNHKCYGQYVMEKIGDVQKFTERWRRHFLQVMQPRFLPKHWDLTKPLVRDRVRSKKQRLREEAEPEGELLL